ncbi:hypothetical protein LWI29_027799 [Acer saccharum]|uniref:Prolamin-like domain-containing protein n=1 Tax=Acer saccharum TaxID=4024 RepID=A0AA39RLR0_ACESA|nr:hypothetical protein LWI29_027799 [Acer saccharum]
MSQASVKFSIALILACVFIVIAPGLAAEPEFPPLFGQDPNVAKCLSTLQSVQGCVQEIITSSVFLGAIHFQPFFQVSAIFSGNK